MTVNDYNGEGIWTREEILARYARLATKMGITARDLSPEVSEHGDRRWVYPVMHKVIEGIAMGDRACIAIGVEFIEEDAKFPFGKILKSNTARALRRAELTEAHKHRIRRRVFGMLEKGLIPHEFGEYAKLVRKIGFDSNDVPDCDGDNKYVSRFRAYFQMVARADS